MKIGVLEVQSSENTVSTVIFDSALGKATAYWRGRAPTKGIEYDVELEIPDVLTWGVDVFPTDAPASIYEEGGRVCLAGEVRSADDDGVIALALQSHILLVEIRNLPTVMPSRVLIRAPQVLLFDTGI